MIMLIPNARDLSTGPSNLHALNTRLFFFCNNAYFHKKYLV
jgi:hypothetical protein